MKEVTIDGIIYVPKVQEEKVLITNVAHLPLLKDIGYTKMCAYQNVLKICAYLNNEFKSDGNQWVITHTLEITYCKARTLNKIFYFTSEEAVEYALLHFKEIFKTFYS